MKIKKIGKMSELAWGFGILLSCLGVVLCIKSSLGMSMFAAIPYSLYTFVKNNIWGMFTQGMCEYIWQAIILIFMCIIIRRFKWKYLLSFATALFAGVSIDFWKWLLGGDASYEQMYLRIIAYVAGVILTALGIALTFRTYMPIQVYELAVKEISSKFSIDISKVKFSYDMITLAIALAVTVLCVPEHFFEIIGIGTIIIVFVNALLIKYLGKLLDTFFEFSPALPKLEKLLNK